MIRLSKLTDYGIALLTHFPADDGQTALTARDLADTSHIPLPTVAKLLKLLSKGAILEGSRGAQGGYRLQRPPHTITIAEIIQALEGPIALTECSGNTHTCGLEATCPVKSNWNRINRAVLGALGGLTLAEMSRPLPRRWPEEVLRK